MTVLMSLHFEEELLLTDMNSFTLLTCSEHDLSHTLSGQETQKLIVKSHWHEGEVFSQLQVIAVPIGRD